MGARSLKSFLLLIVCWVPSSNHIGFESISPISTLLFGGWKRVRVLLLEKAQGGQAIRDGDVLDATGQEQERLCRWATRCYWIADSPIGLGLHVPASFS